MLLDKYSSLLGATDLATSSTSSPPIPLESAGAATLNESSHSSSHSTSPSHLSSPKVSTLPLAQATVLELGCGLGLPGIAALSLGAQSAVFSDFNDDVLEYTWKNIQLNCPQKLDSVQCYGGDWLHLSKLLLR